MLVIHAIHDILTIYVCHIDKVLVMHATLSMQSVLRSLHLWHLYDLVWWISLITHGGTAYMHWFMSHYISVLRNT